MTELRKIDKLEILQELKFRVEKEEIISKLFD